MLQRTLFTLLLLPIFLGLTILSSSETIRAAETGLLPPPPVGIQGDMTQRDYTPYHGRLIYEQTMGENLCALTFDDGPSNYTPKLLDTLDYYGIPATFFMLGVNVAKLPQVVRRVVAEGHEVASHSYRHPNFRRISQQRRWDELDKTNRLLRACGADPVLFRPPYGEQDHALAELAAQFGLRIVTWSYDTEDWKHLPADYTQLRDPRGRVAARGHMRGIFLFHDIHKTTVDDMPRVIAQLKAGGCDRFVTVSDYINELFVDPEPPMHMTMHRKVQHRATTAAPASPAAATSTAGMDAETRAMALASRIVYKSEGLTTQPLPRTESRAEPSSAPDIEGTPALAAWHGFARDKISILPPPSQFANLTRKLREVFSRAPETGASASFFHVGSTITLPEAGSKSYIVRPVSRQTAQRESAF